jgi:Fe2+ or Zn2+ uptake regulation protein
LHSTYSLTDNICMNNTPLLTSVQNIFTTVHTPITVLGIQTLLTKQGLTPNKTTLYRMLQKLKAQGFIDDILFNNKTTYYERKTDHHHHFRCNNCDYIRCITDPNLEAQIHSLQDAVESDGLTIHRHHFFLTGSCSTCL